MDALGRAGGSRHRVEGRSDVIPALTGARTNLVGEVIERAPEYMLGVPS